MLELPRDVEELLIGRPVRHVLTSADRASLAGQRVLVTGGGGSVGSELTRQLAACRPAHLTVFEQSEYALFRTERQLRQRFPDVAIDIVLGDVSRRTDIAAACRATRPHVVYHAAAYKHVALTETAIVAAARTNILGTLETVKAARDVGARFLLISSDKAAEPRSVMGATKRLAELVALGHASRTFRPLAVRFGNILGSAGSFVEIMWQCVEEGRNVPITDPGATRFFMTAAEAVSLVLKADLSGRRPEVYWLDMGAPIRIGTLTERFIEWAASSGRPRVGVEIIGLRPGEKMREELTNQGLEMRQTRHPRIWSARQAPFDDAALSWILRDIRRGVASGDATSVLAAMRAAVVDFVPSGAAVSAARQTSARVSSRRSVAASA